MRLANKYPRLVDVIDEPHGDQTVGEILAGLLAPLSLTLADLTNHYRRRRINARERADADLANALDEWLADVRDCATDAAQLAQLGGTYSEVLAGALSDNGRNETRTLYAAPNGVTPPSAKTAEEVLSVSGEYAEGFDHLQRLKEVEAFKWLLLDKFEPCFLGVIG